MQFLCDIMQFIYDVMQFICYIMQFIYDVMRFICYIMQFIYDVVQFICYIMQFVYDVMQFICDIMQFTCSVTHFCCSIGHFGCAMRPHFIGMLEVDFTLCYTNCLTHNRLSAPSSWHSLICHPIFTVNEHICLKDGHTCPILTICIRSTNQLYRRYVSIHRSVVTYGRTVVIYGRTIFCSWYNVVPCRKCVIQH